MLKLIGPAAFRATTVCPGTIKIGISEVPCRSTMIVGTVCRMPDGTPYADAVCATCGYYLDSTPSEDDLRRLHIRSV